MREFNQNMLRACAKFLIKILFLETVNVFSFKMTWEATFELNSFGVSY